MLLGFNYPESFNRDGSDFGPNFWVDQSTWDTNNQLEASGNISSIPLPPLFLNLDQNLADLKRLGIDVVRWFILGNGNSYGPAPVKKFGRLGTFSATYTFAPPSIVDKRFRRDFTELLVRFKNAGMQLIPSLLNFEFGSEMIAGASPNGTGHGGRADVMRDPVKRKVFLDTMLAELLSASAAFKQQTGSAPILAWEVINEPVWLCVGFGPLSNPKWLPRQAELTDSQMTDFLSDAIKRIEAAGFRSTVGHRYFSDLKKYPTGNMPQFHYYAEHPFPGYTDPAQIQGQRLFSGDSKPFLGEFDSARNRFGNPWPELRIDPSTTARLKLLENEGCEIALIWSDLPDNDVTVVKKDIIKLIDVTRMEIAAYTHGVLPPPERQGP
jgi:hypothetical protein